MAKAVLFGQNVHSSFDHQNTQIDAHSTPNDQNFLPDGRISVPAHNKKKNPTSAGGTPSRPIMVAANMGSDPA